LLFKEASRSRRYRSGTDTFDFCSKADPLSFIIWGVGFAAKVGGLIDSVSTGSGSDRITARLQSKIRSFVIQKSL